MGAGVRAGMGSTMCSFNKLNGDYACENRSPAAHPQARLGFDGFVLTDFGASHSTVGSINEGLDIETGNEFYDGAMLAAIDPGQVTVAMVDQRVHGILRAMFGRACSSTTPSRGDPRRGARGIARETEGRHPAQERQHRAAAPGAGRFVAVIGADANRLTPGRRLAVTPTYREPLLDGIRDRAPGGVTSSTRRAPTRRTHVDAPGPAAVPSAIFTPRAAGAGSARSTSSTDLSGDSDRDPQERGVVSRPASSARCRSSAAGDRSAAATFGAPVGPIHRHVHCAREWRVSLLAGGIRRGG